MASESAMYTPAGTLTPENVGSNAIEAARAVAYRMTAAPSFQEPAGSKHDYDQVVIALSSTPMSLAIDGKLAKTSWTRGEVQFIGRGVAHEQETRAASRLTS